MSKSMDQSCKYVKIMGKGQNLKISESWGLNDNVSEYYTRKK